MRAPDLWKRLPLALRDALPAWVLARVLVGASMGAARVVVDEYPRGALAHNAHVSLLGWDAGIYDQVARVGYADLSTIRFFPLYPLVARALDPVLPGSTRVPLLIVANLAALGFAVVLHRLVMGETGDPERARRAAWFACLAPPAFVMVWGYAEPLFLLLSAAAFLALRRQRFAAAASLAALAALTRPLGVALAVPASVEAWRGMRDADLRGRAARAIAMVAAPLGALAYLLWARDRTGDLFEPFRIQTRSVHRGRPVDPFTGVAHALSEFVDHDRVGPLLHLAWAAIVVALVVVAFRRLAVSYGLYATVTIVVALSSRNLDSFERYAFNAFPVLIAAALVVPNRRAETLVFTASGAAMCVYTLLASLGVYVP